MHGLLRISLDAVPFDWYSPISRLSAQVFRDETRDHRGVLLFT